jgi:hypothetical protein
VLVAALLGQPRPGGWFQHERDAAFGELGLELQDELVDDGSSPRS